MYKMIKEYEHSASLVKARINVLTLQRNNLRKQGKISEITELDLERRIKLLYTEHQELQYIIKYLSDYTRRIEERGKT